MALRLSTGLRNKLVGMEALVTAIKIGANLAIVDGGAGADTITDSDNEFITAGFVAGDIIKLIGCTTGANDTAFTGVRVNTVAAGTLTFDTGITDTAEDFIAGTVICAANGGSLKDIMRNGVLKIYSGSQPALGDTAYSGTLLCTITESSGAFTPGSEANGLEFGDEASGYVEKCTDETWSGAASATGTAGWFRFYANATDAGALSTTLPRIDGSIGTSGADLNMSSTAITSGATYTIDSFKLTLPYQYGA